MEAVSNEPDFFQQETLPTEEQESPKKTVRLPHYALPNVTAVLPDYSNMEQDTIRQAFHSGNYTYLGTVPNDIQTNYLSKLKADYDYSKREGFLTTEQADKAAFMPSKAPTRHKLFQEFEYLPSEYNLADELRIKERETNEKARLQVSNKDFLCSDTFARFKYEEGYLASIRGRQTTQAEIEDSRYPYPVNPYEDAEDLVLRQKWLQSNGFLHGPIIPSGKSNVMPKPTLAMLPDIIIALNKEVEADWPDVNVHVEATSESLIRVKFPSNAGIPNLGITSYMNTLAQNNYLVEKFSLTRVVELWNVDVGDDYIQFFFRPPWITAAAQGETYNTLHPNSRRKANSKSPNKK